MMKARETRRKVCVQAQLRHGDGWADVRIQNLSSRGMMARTEADVRPGSYVEVRCASGRIVVGRIVWRIGSSFGLRSQDRIDVDAILNRPQPEGSTGTCPGISMAADRALERRGAGIGHAADRGREFGRAFQFAAMGLASATVCVLMAIAVARYLSGVAATIGAALCG